MQIEPVLWIVGGAIVFGFFEYNSSGRPSRNFKIFEVIISIAALVLFAVWLSGCSNEKSAGEDCDNKGEVICGTTCVDIGSSDTCGNEDAVLYCDGYEWIVSQKCTGDCSCIEKNDSAYCECPNYY